MNDVIAWISVHALQLLLVVLALIFFVLLAFSVRTAFSYARVATLIIVGTVMMLPFAWLTCAAFKDKTVMNEYTFLPPPSLWRTPTVMRDEKRVPVALLPATDKPAPDDVTKSTVNLGNYRTLFESKPTVRGPVRFWQYIVNSIFLAATGTFISLVFSSMGGYALAKYRFRGRSAIVTFMLASVTIPGVVLLSPNFEVIWRLGWMDTYKALLIPGCVSVFGIFLFRQAMIGVPDDLIEAGRIDGCGEFRIYLTLIMPLVRPMIGAFCLISFLGAWNSFIAPNIYLQTQSKLTLPVVLNQYIGEYAQQYGVFLAGTLLAIIPPAVLFFSLQREFISGLTSGAVKQ